MYFHPILYIMVCFSSAYSISTLSSLYVSVQCVFPYYPLVMMCSVQHVLFPHYPVHYDVFQFCVYFHAILTMICFSSACISVLSSPYAVFQFSMYFHAILSMLCFSSICIWVLTSPYDVEHMLSSPYAMFQFSMYFGTILSL